MRGKWASWDKRQVGEPGQEVGEQARTRGGWVSREKKQGAHSAKVGDACLWGAHSV